MLSVMCLSNYALYTRAPSLKLRECDPRDGERPCPIYVVLPEVDVASRVGYQVRYDGGGQEPRQRPFLFPYLSLSSKILLPRGPNSQSDHRTDFSTVTLCKSDTRRECVPSAKVHHVQHL